MKRQLTKHGLSDGYKECATGFLMCNTPRLLMEWHSANMQLLRQKENTSLFFEHNNQVKVKEINNCLPEYRP